MRKRKLLVTSALPYANGPIHIGHMVEHIQTDIFVRFQRLIGNTCYYMCADDAHGTAIMLSAEKQGVTPETFIKNIQNSHMADFNGFHITHDHYYSTHSPENKELSENIFHAAQAAGAIFEKDIEQYFCEEKNIFLADRYIKGTCPKCGAQDQYGDSCEKCFATYSATQLIDPISIFSNQTPILKKSTHYFFDVQKFEPMIKGWLLENHVITPVKNKLQEWFDAGLKSWDISRDAPYFGFQIPGEESKFFYVWLDAPIGYMATTKHWCEQSKQEKFDHIWKSGDYEIHHFIGKDILYFHTLFWPAMLHVGGYQLPEKVRVHGFLTINGEKMSKSRGTFILASDYLKKCNPEFLRYYYAAKLTESMDDLDLNSDDFMYKINSEVLGKVVNIASRLGSILTKKCNGMCTKIDPLAAEMLAGIREKKGLIQSCYESLDTNKAMREIMVCAGLANTYIDHAAPWAVVKEDTAHAEAICTAGLNALKIIAIYLKPVIPKIVEGIENFLQIAPLDWSDIEQEIVDHQVKPYEHLVSRLVKEDVVQIFESK